jgi:putative ABC transport system substrate-binding protein
MREFNWVEGSNFAIVRSDMQTGSWDFGDAATRVVSKHPDLILVTNSATARAAHRATRSIPIVMFTSGYPVEAGLAESLARPGKNVTGNSLYAGTGVWGKLLQLLTEVKPSIKRVTALWTYVPPSFAAHEEVAMAYKELHSAEQSLGLKLDIIEATADQISEALLRIGSEQPDALLLTSWLSLDMKKAVIQFAAMRRIPNISDYSWESGPADFHPLISYSPVARALMHSAVAYIDKILRGASPGELPIQLPAKFEMVINQRLANAIGLTIPEGLMFRADRVLD